jgi:hypothetical protein
MFSYECIPPNTQGRPMQGMIYCLTWQLPSAAQVAFSFPTFVQNQKSYSDLRFYQGNVKEERNASPITLSDLHAMLGRNHTNRLQIS